MRLWLKECLVGCAGPFRDWRLPPLTPGLNLLFGLNEAGKTTLLHFLRGMLFGFEKTPLASPDGADPAGALVLADDAGGEWRLSRVGKGKKARIDLSSQGVALPPGALPGLLHHVTKPVFEGVFAFGLAELGDIKTLEHQGVQELLYSASLGLGRVSLGGVWADLKKEADALFNPDPRAKKPEGNRLLAELAQVRQTLRDLERAPEEYQEILQHLSRLETQIDALTAELGQAREEHLWCLTLHKAWPVWQQRAQTLADLEAVPVVEAFPADGLLLLDKLHHDLEALHTTLRNLQEQLEQAHRQRAALKPDQALLEQGAALEDLLREEALVADRQERLTRVELELEQARGRLDEALARLGPGWDEARLLAFPLSLGWRQGLRDRLQGLEEAREACRRAQAARCQAEAAYEERDAALAQAAAEGVRALAGWLFRWGLAALGGVAALAAGLSAWWRFWYAAAGAGLLAGVLGLMALLFRLHLAGLQRRRLADLAGEREAAADALRRAQGEEQGANLELQRLETAWGHLLAELQLPPEYSPAMVLELAREVEKARELLQARREKEAERQRLAEFLQNFLTRFNELARQLGRPPVPPDQVGPALARYHQEYEAQQEAEAEARRLDLEISRLAGRRRQAEEALEELLARQHDLWAAAGAAGEEEFRRRARDYQRRQELEARLRHLGAQLRVLAGEEALPALLGDLERFSEAELTARLAQAAGRLEDLNHRLDRLKDERGRLQERRETLEQSEALGQALLSEQTLAARLEQLARRWAVLTLARHFLEQGRGRFEAESQPQVLREAGRFLAELTEGRYLQVVTPLEDHRLLAVNRQGRHLPAEHLSRGTLEQLYLALRCALVRTYDQQGINLPLVLDDILVNFDHRRARRAVHLLAEMSASHQVLFFTCHRHVVDLITDTLGEAAPSPILLEDSR